MYQDFADSGKQGEFDLGMMIKGMIFSSDTGDATINDFPNHPSFLLISARIQAQVAGPNRQQAVPQACHTPDLCGNYLVEEHYSDIIADGYEPYGLLSWLSYSIGHGDPNCGNWMFWSALVYSGNRLLFQDRYVKNALLTLLQDYLPDNTDIHPELTKIFNQQSYRDHFSAQRIPSLQFDPTTNSMLLHWPGDFSECVGEAPSLVKLELPPTKT